MDIVFLKNDFWHYVYAKFHILFVKYVFEKKSNLSYKSGFHLNTFFFSYAVYKANDETYSLDKLSTSYYYSVAY